MENNGAHIHSFKETVVPATCKEVGYTLHQCECGYEFKDNFKPASVHDYFLVKCIEPNCTESGSSQYRCTHCMTTKTEQQPPLGHSWSEWSVQEFPTCTAGGRQIRLCTRCNAVEEDTLPAKGHKLKFIAPSPTNKDMDEYFCENCGETILKPSAAVKKKKSRKVVKWLLSSVAALLVFAILAPIFNWFIIPSLNFHTAEFLIEQEQYHAAYLLLQECEDNEDAQILSKNFYTVYASEVTTYYDNSGNITEYRITERNKDGNLTYSAKADKNMYAEYIKEYTYDQYGNEVEAKNKEGGFTTVTRTSYQYDSRGNILERIAYNSSGKMQSKTKYQYDNNDNIILIENYSEDGVLTSKYTYEFDWRNNETLSVCYKGNAVSSKRVSEYNWRGDITKVTNYSGSTYNGHSEYTYTFSGEPKSIVYYNSAGNISRRKEYKYDLFGHMTEDCTIYDDYSRKETYQYDLFGNRTEYAYYFDNAQRYRYEFKYDLKGNLIEEIYYEFLHDGNTGKTTRTEYKYDLWDNPTSSITYDSDGEITGSTKISYDLRGNEKQVISFDKNGNETSKYEFEYDFLGNLSKKTVYNENGRIASITEYSDPIIMYYEYYTYN